MGATIVSVLAVACIVIGFGVGFGVWKVAFGALEWFVAAIALNTLTLPKMPRMKAD